MMKNIILTTLLALTLAACSSEMPDSRAVSVGDVELRILPQVINHQTTRAAVDGTAFPLNAKVGLGIESTAQTLNPIYDNFYAQKGALGWEYILGGTYVGRKLAGFSNWGIVKVMGYHPYDQSVTNFDAVPFRIANDGGVTTTEIATTDYMVAETKSKTMGIGQSEVTLQFEHLMTRIDLYIARPYNGPKLKLSKVVLEIDNRDFVVAGTYDAKDPAIGNIPALITQIKTTKKLEIATSYEFWTTSSIMYFLCPLVVMPQLAEADGDAEVTVTYHFTDTDGSPFFFDDLGGNNPVTKFKLSDIDDGGGNKGFLRGKRYQIEATLGTYTHFDGVPVVKEWPMDENTDPEHIDI